MNRFVSSLVWLGVACLGAGALGAVVGERTAELYPFVATLMGVRLDGPDAERLAGIDADGL